MKYGKKALKTETMEVVEEYLSRYVNEGTEVGPVARRSHRLCRRFKTVRGFCESSERRKDHTMLAVAKRDRYGVSLGGKNEWAVLERFRT